MCYHYYDEKIRKLTLFDDDFMTVFFDKDIPTTELILHVILDVPNLTVESVNAQETLKNLHGHSLRLDIKAQDDQGKAYDIEVQQENDGADPRRARYHSSMLDSYQLSAGAEYRELRDTYVIFITRNDVLHGKQPVYHIRRTVQQQQEQPLGDGSHIIYVNGAWNGDDPIGHLVHDFACNDPENMYYPELADRSRLLKGTEKGEATMSWWGDELRAEGWEKGLEEGRAEERARGMENTKQTVRNLHIMGLEDCAIAMAVGTSVEQVQQWLSATPAPVK